MAGTYCNHIKKIADSQFKNVSQYSDYNGNIFFLVKGNKLNPYKTEREAGIQADLQRIKRGKEPVNVLKRK